MNDKRGKNLAASVRDRLLALARVRGEDFQLRLTPFGLERLLYRLSQSAYRDRFILKGAMLFVLWGDQPHRPTRDVDFLAFGDSSEAGLQAIFRDLCNVTVEDDGLTLIVDSVQVGTGFWCSQHQLQPRRPAGQSGISRGDAMILKGIYLTMDFHGPEGRTPLRGWRRAGDAFTGGAKIETAPRG